MPPHAERVNVRDKQQNNKPSNGYSRRTEIGNDVSACQKKSAEKNDCENKKEIKYFRVAGDFEKRAAMLALEESLERIFE